MHFLAFLFCVFMTAINAAIMFNDPNSWSLFGLIVCGLMSVFNLFYAIKKL